MGAGNEIFYDNGSNSDYALITDFNISQDSIELPESTFSSGIISIVGTGIFFNNDLIAVVEGVSSSDISSGFDFV
ncbi:hypothetical protein LC613_13170 [Nostoc sphaeroides CHAB 2801]|uniref:hypothetical protein n=1 Tax=Nostoc sphaeroides TaxID=446679 RepID=UPI001E433F4E|nr:hypothetical protein [Nostoc sphaeroides]MCC5628980.1 hypothetical protein [Nostoc sphaeroides CHAB 2801]